MWGSPRSSTLSKVKNRPLRVPPIRWNSIFLIRIQAHRILFWPMPNQFTKWLCSRNVTAFGFRRKRRSWPLPEPCILSCVKRSRKFSGTRSLWIAFALALMSVALEAMLDDPPDRAILRGRAEEWSTERIIETYLSILPIIGTALNSHVWSTDIGIILNKH